MGNGQNQEINLDSIESGKFFSFEKSCNLSNIFSIQNKGDGLLINLFTEDTGLGTWYNATYILKCSTVDRVDFKKGCLQITGAPTFCSAYYYPGASNQWEVIGCGSAKTLKKNLSSTIVTIEGEMGSFIVLGNHVDSYLQKNPGANFLIVDLNANDKSGHLVGEKSRVYVSGYASFWTENANDNTQGVVEYVTASQAKSLQFKIGSDVDYIMMVPVNKLCLDELKKLGDKRPLVLKLGSTTR